MLANKTLLSVTLAATFAAGASAGYAVKPPMTQQSEAAAAYARQLAQLEDKGYDAAEMKEAREAYTVYLADYEHWWNECLDLYKDSLDKVDRKLDKRLEALAASHAQRTGTK